MACAVSTTQVHHQTSAVRVKTPALLRVWLLDEAKCLSRPHGALRGNFGPLVALLETLSSEDPLLRQQRPPGVIPSLLPNGLTDALWCIEVLAFIRKPKQA